MTVAVAEESASAAEAGASEASSGAGQAVSTSGKTVGAPFRNRPAASNGHRPRGSQRAAKGSGSSAAVAAGAGGSQRQGGQQGGSRRQSGRSGELAAGLRSARGRPAGNANYQMAVLGEFVAAVLLVSATPFAKKGKAGLSPYATADVVQLIAITLLYLFLALISGVSQGAGRFAAWFGLLILLVTGLGEAARLAKFLDIFDTQARKDAQPQNPSQNVQAT